MDNLINFLSILAISQLVFLGTYTYANFRSHRLARLLLIFSICLTSFLLGGVGFIEYGPFTGQVLSSLALLTPAALWVFAVSLFRDEREIPLYGLGLIVLYFSLRTLDSYLSNQGYDTGQPGYFLGYLLPLFIMIGLSIHVIYLGIEGRRADLIEERRRIRIPFVIIMGFVVVFTLVFGSLSNAVNVQSPSNNLTLVFDVIRLLIFAAVFLWAFLLNLALFKLTNEAELLLQTGQRTGLGDEHQQTQAAMVEKKDGLVAKIEEAMDEQRLYTETGFTITKLAIRLSVSEQRLRTTINQKLGFRNFNQFLNHYRIREATKQLSISDEPISKIAMEVGYNSLSAFNKSFKESHGVPPREYRTFAELSTQE